MASRNYAPDRSLMRGVTRIQGVLTGTGASAPTITAALGVTFDEYVAAYAAADAAAGLI